MTISRSLGTSTTLRSSLQPNSWKRRNYHRVRYLAWIRMFTFPPSPKKGTNQKRSLSPIVTRSRAKARAASITTDDGTDSHIAPQPTSHRDRRRPPPRPATRHSAPSDPRSNLPKEWIDGLAEKHPALLRSALKNATASASATVPADSSQTPRLTTHDTDPASATTQTISHTIKHRMK